MKVMLAGVAAALLASASYRLTAETKTFKTNLTNSKQQAGSDTHRDGRTLIKIELEQNVPGISRERMFRPQQDG